jgi:hypothetical protein
VLSLEIDDDDDGKNNIIYVEKLKYMNIFNIAKKKETKQ